MKEIGCGSRAGPRVGNTVSRVIRPAILRVVKICEPIDSLAIFEVGRLTTPGRATVPSRLDLACRRGPAGSPAPKSPFRNGASRSGIREPKPSWPGWAVIKTLDAAQKKR